MKWGKSGTVVTVALAVLSAAGAAEAKKMPRGAWQVSRIADPITGASSCVVAAADTIMGGAFTRVGYLYPVVENNAQHGLLVGVSSGGRFRVPTGDVLWRVDDQPFREMKAADNPGLGGGPVADPSNVASKAMQDLTEVTMRYAATATSTSTVASGPKARDMLDEMLKGRTLIFRAAQAAPAYGLPTGGANRVGQVTKDGLRPIPLDNSFHEGLKACSLTTS